MVDEKLATMYLAGRQLERSRRPRQGTRFGLPSCCLSPGQTTTLTRRLCCLDCGAVKFPKLSRLPPQLRVLLLVVGVYLFLVSITLLGDGFKGLGSPFIRTLLALTATPVAGLFVGVLATSLVQSSSCTTSLVVGMVASGALDVSHAIPIVMGANIGTTITNTIVSLAHVTRRQEFERAFPAAIVHDVFNILTVALLLPLEILFHPIARSSALLGRAFAGVGGFTAVSPLKVTVQPVADLAAGLLGHTPVLELALGGVFLFLSLRVIVDMMRSLVSRRLELVVDKYLFGNALKAALVGLAFTALVQSSSVTTSIAVPMAGAGLLTLQQFFPYALGANVGTTVTAILAALVTGSPAGIQIAFAHLLFNVFGGVVWYPMRAVPIVLSQRWGRFCARHRFWAVLYVVIAFFAIPLVVVILTRRP